MQEGGRICRAVPEGELQKYLYEDAQTLYQSFRRGARESGGGDCLGYRETGPDGRVSDYKWLTYQDVITRAERLAAGLTAKGVPVGQDAFVGIYAQNSPSWIIAEQACFVHSRVVVPLYDTLGPDACTFIVNKVAMRAVLVDTNRKAASLLAQAPDCPLLKLIVVVEAPSAEVAAAAKKAGVEVTSMAEVEAAGGRVAGSQPDLPPSPKDLATVCFTSGTTGTPKGVMLTHGNIIADVTPFMYIKYARICPDDVLMSFLPLAHMFERVCETLMYMHGCKVGFFRGDIKLLTEDIKTLRPTFLVVVPRLLNRIYDKVMGEASKSGVKRRLVDWAVNSKTAYLKKSIVRNDTLWDHIVFKKVREAMGGRVKLMISGSAPLAENVLTFMRAALGCVVLEGYGQTECVAAATLTLEGDHEPGHVGVPIPCAAVKLADVPEMNYLAKEGKGEICIRGYNVSPGYFKEPEKTAETFDKDGWLHTGDVGTWLPNGTLKIIDRKKHIFKLAQGEYIAPEKIENIYAASKYTAQVFVHGESLKVPPLPIPPIPPIPIAVRPTQWGAFLGRRVWWGSSCPTSRSSRPSPRRSTACPSRMRLRGTLA